MSDHAKIRMDEAEQLISRYESAALDWLRRGRGAASAVAALGCREMAVDQLVLSVEWTRRLAEMQQPARPPVAPEGS